MSITIEFNKYECWKFDSGNTAVKTPKNYNK